MDIKKAFKYIEDHADEYLDFLEKICSYEGRAYDKDNINVMLDYIDEFASENGFYTERTPFEACADFLTVELNHGEAPGAVTLAHTDTVHDIGRFGYPAVRREGDRMIGPGTIDCKGGIAVSLLAMKALSDIGYKKCVRLLLTSDEEISNTLGGEPEQIFFREKVSGFPYALNCETTEGNEVVTSRKGILKYRIEVRGIGGHAGINYFNCKNAVLECAHKIVALEGHSERGGMTFSCNVIKGGAVTNVIPDMCEFTVDVRVVTQDQCEIADRLVREIAEKSFIGETTSNVTRLGMRPPMEPCEATDKLFSHLLEVSRKWGLGELTPVASGGGSDSAYTQRAGVTSLCGLGASGEFCHTSREYVKMDTVALRAKLLTALLVEDAQE